MKIKYLPHTEINFQKWDVCIQSAFNSLVYAESWYLDIVSPNWEALVSGNYEYVMPLPVKKRYSFSFLTQPPLTQQLGVFSSHNIDEDILEHFIKKIPYKSYHLYLNEQNLYSKGLKQPNFILNLNRNYEAVFSLYSTNTKRNLKKAQHYYIEIKANLSASDFLEFYHSIKKNYNELSKTKLNTLVQESLKRKKMTIYGVYNEENKLISALCLLHSRQRLVYLLPVSSNEGKENLAMFKVVDEIIRNYENKNVILDFEGSKIENIAHFYQGFGAEKRFYYEAKKRSVNDFIKCFRFLR